MCNSQVYVTHMWMQLIRNTKKRENKLKIELQRMKKNLINLVDYKTTRTKKSHYKISKCNNIEKWSAEA